MQKSSIVVFAAVIITVLSSPPNIVKGNYVYDPNSIPQNEMILKLFVRLAAHTADRLSRLKIESDRNRIGYKDKAEEDTEKIISPILEEVKKIVSDFGKKKSYTVQVPADLQIMNADSKTKAFVTEDSKDKYQDNSAGDNSGRRSLERISGDKTELSVETTTEIGTELKNGDNLGMENGLGNTEDNFRRELNRRWYIADEKVKDIQDYSDPITTLSDHETVTSTSEEQDAVEVENRALFNFEKNNYVTHYTDQSINTNRAETSVNNYGVSHPGNVLINQEVRSRLIDGDKLNHYEISGQGDSASGVVVNQLVESSGSSNTKTVDQSRNENQTKIVAELGTSGGNFGSFVINKAAGSSRGGEIDQSGTIIGNFDLQTNHEKIGEISTGGIVLQNKNIIQAVGDFATSNLKHDFGNAGASVGLGANSEEIQRSDNSSQKSGFKNLKQKQEEHDHFHGSGNELGFVQTSASLGTKANGFYAGALNNEGKVYQGESHAQQESKIRHESIGEDKRQQKLNGLSLLQGVGLGGVSLSEERGSATGSIHDTKIHHATEIEKVAQLSSLGSSSKESKHTSGSQLNVGGHIGVDLQLGDKAQIHHASGLEKSAQLSSLDGSSKETQQAFGSGFNVGGKINLNSEQHRSKNLEQVHGSISDAANVQAGSGVKFEASKGLSAGIGLFNAKMNLVMAR